MYIRINMTVTKIAVIKYTNMVIRRSKITSKYLHKCKYML